MKTDLMSLARKNYLTAVNGITENSSASSSSLRLAWPPPKDLPVEKLITQKEMDEWIAAARASERKRIGQELHDNVNQILTTVKLYMAMINPVKEEECTKQKCISYLVMAIDEIRALSGEFTSTKKREAGLIASIQNIVNDLSVTTAIKIKFTYESHVEKLDSNKKQALLRIVQEQVKNIIKYSEATKVTIQLLCRNSEVLLQIKDNGIGFDATKKSRGIGLVNIFERARLNDGKAELQTAPGKGCSLSVLLPG